MFVLGIDLGSRTCHAVVVDDVGTVMERASVGVSADLPGTARRALESLGTRSEEVTYVAATGFGRYQVSFRDIAITDVTCHAYGARALFPTAGCVVDMGAHHSRAMRMREDGRVLRFKVNDKCASGAGKFLERVARALEIPLAEIGSVSLRAQAPVTISSICAVLAESEVINHVTEGRAVEDILMGAHLSIAERVIALVRQVGIQGDVVLTGAVSRNAGMVAALEKRLGGPIRVSPDSEYAGAIGAALLAQKRLRMLERDVRRLVS